MPITITPANLIDLACDVLVNPTDSRYSGSGGADRALHEAAGPALDEVCRALPPLHPGEVRETSGFGLPCRYIIHTVGPVWIDGNHGEPDLLRSCYRNALRLALTLNARSIGFPLISSGANCYPKERVLHEAQAVLSEFLRDCGEEPEVMLCVYDRESYALAFGGELRDFLDSAQVPDGLAEKREEERPLSAPRKRPNRLAGFREKSRKQAAASAGMTESFGAMTDAAPVAANAALPKAAAPDLDSWVRRHDDSFAVTLLKLIDRKGMTDVECYKKANVSRKTFSKINSEKDYRPSKQTVLAFAIALELTLPETEQLLKTVGFSLSHSSTFDLIIEYFIVNGRYDVYEINEALYRYDQTCLGA